MSNDNQHSILPPSSADIWVPCPPSRQLEMMTPPEPDGLEGPEGTAAHWVVSERMAQKAIAVGTVAPNGIVVTQEMIDGADIMEADVTQFFELRHQNLLIETPVRIPNVDAECWGTPDLHGLKFTENTVYLWDYKFGYSYVPAVRRWQFILYAGGIYDRNNLNTNWKFRIACIQPRSYHRDGPIKVWNTDWDELGHLISVAQRSASKAFTDNEFNTGDHCKHCRGRVKCEALQRVGSWGVDESLRSTPLDMTPLGIANELTALQTAVKRMQYRVDALEDFAVAELKNGRNIPGYGLEQQRGNLAWKMDMPTVIATGQALGIDLTKQAVITPTQAKNKGLDATVIAALADRSYGEFKLTALTEDSIRDKLTGRTTGNR